MVYASVKDVSGASSGFVETLYSLSITSKYRTVKRNSRWAVLLRDVLARGRVVHGPQYVLGDGFGLEGNVVDVIVLVEERA